MQEMSRILIFSLIFLPFSLCSIDEISKKYHLDSNILPYLLGHFSEIKQACLDDSECSEKLLSKNSSTCLGFEEGCSFENSYSADLMKCSDNIGSKLHNSYWEKGDFGYVGLRFHSLVDICSSEDSQGSSLKCSQYLEYCYGRNFFIDFKSLDIKNSKRYKEDVIHEGEIGGECSEINKQELIKQTRYKSYLQSWAQEVMYFHSYNNFTMESCDLVLDKPTILIKLDASVSMYHHFCDFYNIFASQLLNGSFSKDVQVVWWDTHPMGFRDLTFGDTWKAFSNHKPIELMSLAGKRPQDCSGSGLTHLFSRLLLYRLGIKRRPYAGDGKLRVTFLCRGTQYRKILNEDELVESLKSISRFEVLKIDYNHRMPFLEQLEITRNTDIFIGMHGSGLTHSLFLPDWAGVFELYNCGDVNCYRDLARLRGVFYVTWQNEKLVFPEGEGRSPTSGHPSLKFTNFKFNPKEFLRIVKLLAYRVRTHPAYLEYQKGSEHEEVNKEEL